MTQIIVDRQAARAAQPITVTRIGPTIGAEIGGVDFSRPVERATADAIHDALMRHKVVSSATPR